VVPPNLALKCKIMFHIHDAVGPKHPNLPKMLHQTTQLYWWPDMKAWVTRYMENCKQCHHNPATARTASPTITSLRSRVRKTQEQYRATLEKWGLLYSIDGKVDEGPSNWLKEGLLVIPPDEALRHKILQVLHDAPTAGHPSQDETFTQVSHLYWWPGMRAWVTDYVAGCVVCQQNKNITHRAHTPLYCIPTPEDTLPFQQIALDLITRLPPNRPHDSVLTIVDHGCSQVAIFLLCATTITGPRITQSYFDNVYRWFGLPSKVISDQDPVSRRTSAKRWLVKSEPYRTCQLHSISKPMASPNERTSGLNNTCVSSQTHSRRTGVNGLWWPLQYITTTSTPH